MPRRRDLARVTAALFVGVAVFTAVPAWAGFRDVTTIASLSIRTGTLAAPTGLTATASCVGTILKTPRVTLSWVASASLYATGYAISRLSGGSYVQIGTVSGRTTTTYADTTVALATTYTYQVRTTYRSWYADSSTASATTAILCL